MPSYIKYVAAALAAAAALPLSSAQTYSKCNPLKKTCPEDVGLNNYTFYSDFTQGESAFKHWNTTFGKVGSGPLGAEFTIHKQGDAPTLETEFAFLFGVAEVKMRAANGTAVVSSIVLESDDLDEIDWETLGGNTGQVETNYFGKGNTTSYDRAVYVNVASPQTTFHTYTVNWTPESVVWFVDGNAVRTLNYSDAVGGTNFPQTPMRLRIGIWAGGDPSNNQGTIEWAGGLTDYSQAPFTMYIQSVNITNYTPAASYKYSDNSGSYQSIKSSNATSTSHKASDGDADASSSSSGTSTASSSSSASSTDSNGNVISKQASNASPATSLGGLYLGLLLTLIITLFTGLIHL